MNAYLLTKCRSEQQLLNELTKLVALGGADAGGKRTGELLRELAVVYASPAPPLAAPPSVVRDLSALLALLRDRKDDLRAARLVLCLLSRLAEQFAAQPRGARAEASVSAMTSLMAALKAAELSHASAARQCAALRLFALLSCALGREHEALVARTKAALSQSPAGALLLPLVRGPKALTAADKKQLAAATSRKDFPAQLAVLAASTHAVRFHVPTPSVVAAAMVDDLVHAAFLPSGAAPRHAAATLLRVFSSGETGAAQVLRALEAFASKFCAASLRSVADPLAAIYLLRLCGRAMRLRVASHAGASDAQPHGSAAASELLDLSFAPPSPKLQVSSPLEGVVVSRELADRLRDWVMELAASAGGAAVPATQATRAVVLTAVEEAVTDAPAAAPADRSRVFEVAAAALLRMLREPGTAANAPLLHRLCRAAQFVAESFDRAVDPLAVAAASPLGRVADGIRDLVTHPNAFVASEALRAQIWLLPRHEATSEATDDAWRALEARLAALPADRILPESRRALADALLLRASPATGGVEGAILARCLAVTLRWFQSRPCEWHAETLVAVWQQSLFGRAAPQHELEAAADARRRVLESIITVLSMQHAQPELQSVAHLVQQSALAFLCRDGTCSRLLPSASAVAERSRRTLFLALSKHMLLAPFVSRRLAVQALAQWSRELQASGAEHALSGQITALLQHLTRDASVLGSGGHCVVESAIHSERAQQTLGVRDIVLAELQRPSAPKAAFAVSPLAPASALQLAHPVSTALDGLF